VPHRGKRNDSRYLPYVAETIARVKGMTVEDVARRTMENGKRFFAIDQTTTG
jgi:TatD DNase family protein